MRIVITGASGNVGTALLRRLHDEPEVDEVVAVSRRPPRDDDRPNVRWVAADVLHDDLRPLIAGTDAVVHLAWQLQPQRDPGSTWDVNVRGTDRLLAAVAETRIGAFVYASSVGAYAPAPDGLIVDETWPTHGVPTSAYSREKAYNERLLDTFEREHPDVRVVRLRPGLIFQRAAASEVRRFFLGSLFPDRLARPGVVPIFPVADGVAFQAVHADDVADAYARAVHSDERGAFNVAAEPVLDLRTIAGLLDARPVPVPLPVLRAGASATWRLRLHPVEPGWLDLAAASPVMDTSRVRARLGWSPAHDATHAVRELLHGIAEGAGEATPTLEADAASSRTEELATAQGARYDPEVGA